jgi:hypothetical protein
VTSTGITGCCCWIRTEDLSPTLNILPATIYPDDERCRRSSGSSGTRMTYLCCQGTRRVVSSFQPIQAATSPRKGLSPPLVSISA